MHTPDRELEAPDPGVSVIDQLSHEEAAYVAGELFVEDDYWRMFYDDPMDAIDAYSARGRHEAAKAEEIAKETIALSRQRKYAEKRARELNDTLRDIGGSLKGSAE